MEVGSAKASVAVIFRPGKPVKVLLIERAKKKRDPWSGQIAFPGGRVQPGDSSFRDTAIRETREEVGMDLHHDSRFLGYLGLFKARTRGMLVVPSVFVLRQGKRPRISTNREVESYRWVPIGVFLTDSARSVYSRDYGGTRLSFPSYVVGGYLVWGLTERILSALTAYLY